MRTSNEKASGLIAPSSFRAPFAQLDLTGSYFTQSPGQPYCQVVVNLKLAKFCQQFAAKLKK